MNTAINLGTTAGERITIALVVLTLCVEVLSDNACNAPQAEPISAAACQEICWDYETCKPAVKRWEAFACECVAPGGGE